MMSIHTVAAGRFGACTSTAPVPRRPGFRRRRSRAGELPARGGPLTVTDANLLLGKIQPEHFSKGFSKEGYDALIFRP